MKHYVGIDLGTTNSAIASFDGENARLYLSPEQHEVTPSAIFITSRGSKYVGKRAYDQAAHNPDNSATLFKRLMGTSTPIRLPGVNLTMSPEECSAEVLRVLFGYLPEEIRNDTETGTVITVPAAFNQMQKDATMSAAEMAGIGKVALMQEPVAAVMSVMRQRKTDGIFLVYDLGGGTLDIAIAQSTAGRVNLIGHGGIQMCGGRDFDRILRDNVVLPWLFEHFDLPRDVVAEPQFKRLMRLVEWSAEQAKIELSKKEDAVIAMDESEIRMRDLAGDDIYLDVPLTRRRFDELVLEKLDESIAAARETMTKAGVDPRDVGRIVFVGGPTQYKPLRDKIAFELGIAASTDVKPMTAVAEGAAVFAESIDWSSESRGRKKSRGAVSAGGALDLVLNFIARTPDHKARVGLDVRGEAMPGTEIQIDSLDTGWSSGRAALKKGASFEVPLAKPGENNFKIFVFDSAGGAVALGTDKFVIVRTAASVDAIPASHSIGIKARTKAGGAVVLEYIVRQGEPLPKKGKKEFKAATTLKGQGPDSLRFKVWEGEIESPVTDNRWVGMFRITGRDIGDAVIAAGDKLVCEYEVLDSGNIMLDVSIPSVGGTFNSGHNLYSRQEALVDLSAAGKAVEHEIGQMKQRVDDITRHVDDPRLTKARSKLDAAEEMNAKSTGPEEAGEALQNIQEAKKLLAAARKDHLKSIRKMELDNLVAFFDQTVRSLAKPTEATAFDNLAATARRTIENNSADFESHLDDLRGRCFGILWRQDWFVIDRFKYFAGNLHLFSNTAEHGQLIEAGNTALKANDMEGLRAVVGRLYSMRIATGGEDDMFATANIVLG